MRQRWALLFTICLLLSAGTVNADPAKVDAANLQGTWVVVKLSDAGLFPDDLRLLKVVVKGDQLTFVMKRLNTDCRLKLNAAKSPKEMDLEVTTAGRSKGAVMPGIYLLEGDELLLCYNVRGSKDTRPTKFVGDSNAGWQFVMLKREKP